MMDPNWKLQCYRRKCMQLRKTRSIMQYVIGVLAILLLSGCIAISVLNYDIKSKTKDIERLEGHVLSLIEELKILESENRLSTYKGQFTITSYCSCPICCGDWATNRPTIGNREVVITASSSFAEQGVTVAVDPKVIPYGTKLYIEGIGVRIAQDTGKDIKGNKLDIYYDNHEDAKNEGIYTRNVWIINE